MDRNPPISSVPAETVLLRDWPEAIIEKVFAERNGLAIYRTGEPCETGRHCGYRSVYTGACISCN